MFGVASTVRALTLTGCWATVAAADSATRSSLPWIVAGGGPVARSGRTLFFGNATTVQPRANRASGMVVFSDAESVGEPIAAATLSSSPRSRTAPAVGTPVAAFQKVP